MVKNYLCKREFDRLRNVPEHDTYDNIVEFVYGVGGVAKKNSSSWILDEWKNPKTIRPWGWYRVLDDRHPRI